MQQENSSELNFINHLESALEVPQAQNNRQTTISHPNYVTTKVQNKCQQKQVEKTQVQIQVQKMTLTQPFQLTQENLNCILCYRYAINAVLCKNKQCKKLFCTACVQNSVQKAGNRCPYCRIQPFQIIQSPYRNIINKKELRCQLCKQKYVLQEEENHYRKNCRYFLRITCEYCGQCLQKNEVAKHTRIKHQDKLDEIIQRMYNNPRRTLDPKILVNGQKYYLNKINKTPHLGTTGKFYCGGKLEGPKCSCCDGYCGPGNGENCVQCMKLDMKRFGLPKGFLLNTEGNVCWRTGDEFVCGIMLRSYDNNRVECKEGSVCYGCSRMTDNMQRYIDLL